MILVGILFFNSSAYKWEDYHAADKNFIDLKNYINDKVRENSFLNAINMRMYLNEFYGKVNPAQGKIKHNDQIEDKSRVHFYMQYCVYFYNGFPQHGFFVSVRDDFVIVDKDMPNVNIGGGVVHSDLFFKIKRYDIDYENYTNTVIRDDSISAEGWANIYDLVVKYIEQFRVKKESQRKEY
jgi:hypothetical protein